MTVEHDPTAYLDLAQVDRSLAELSDIAVHGSPMRSRDAWQEIDQLLDFRNFIIRVGAVAIVKEIHE